jgi:hypothetical protein
MLFQKRVLQPKFDIYVFITITGTLPLLLAVSYIRPVIPTVLRQ